MIVLKHVAVIFLLLLSALFSGLSLGLMSLDPFSLHRKSKLGNEAAKKVYPLRKRGNQLLCTLLIGNIAVNSTIAVLLSSLTTGFIAGLTATALIVIFGEILPQAVFARHALEFGAKFSWMVYPFFIIFYPITKPISWALDKILRKELPSTYSRGEFQLLLQEHKESSETDLTAHELSLLQKGLQLSTKQVRDIMTLKKDVFFISHDAVLDKELIRKIKKEAHSRIPVLDAEKQNIIGILYSKDLVAVNPLDEIKVEIQMRIPVYHIHETDRLDRVLNLFKKKYVHLFAVVDSSNHLTGIVTLEDVLEEIVGEIVDEYDWLIDIRKAHALHK